MAASGTLLPCTLGMQVNNAVPTYAPLAMPTADGPGPDILISSTGGLGTTTFMQEMERVRPPLSLNHHADIDHLKHTPWRKIWQENSTATKMHDVKKIIYLHGEIIRSILSLARRGYMNPQARKIRTDPVPKGMGADYPTIQEYADLDGDYFQLENHFNGFWYQCQYPIAFVDVTKKTDHLQELGAWLGVDPDELTRRLTPWRTGDLQVAEKLAQRGSLRRRSAQVANMTDALRAAEAAGELDPVEGAHDYRMSAEILGKLQAKFAGFSTRLEKLGGLYIRNECTPEEKAASEAWMASYLAGATSGASTAAASASGTPASAAGGAAAPVASRSAQSARDLAEMLAVRMVRQAPELSQLDLAAKRRIENKIATAVEEELAPASQSKEATEPQAESMSPARLGQIKAAVPPASKDSQLMET